MAQHPPSSEDETRKRRIDPKLEAAGWTVVPFDAKHGLPRSGCHAVTEYPTDNGPADYALVHDGRILGIVEAKKVTLGPQNVLTQAERYSKGIKTDRASRSFGVPLLYSTNGEVIWFHDIRHPMNLSRRIAAFHTPNAMTEMLDRDSQTAAEGLLKTPNDHPKLRPYQREANDGIERAIAGRKRKMLVAMATGTGKTFTLVNEAYRLMKSETAKRILFLVDRRALAAQAVRAFASFDAEPGLMFDDVYEVYSQKFHREDFDADEKFDPKVLPTSYLTNPKPGHTFVYVCTIQRMTINLFGRSYMLPSQDDEGGDEDAEKIDIPIHAFDLVIADECHRGYSSAELSVWRSTLDHFDGIKVGLTATPAAHTVAYFENMAYRYEYSRAVQEGYLVDFDPVAISSEVRLKGIFLKEGEHVGVVDTTTGLEQMDLLEDERQIETAEIEQKATSPDSNRKILEEVNKYAQAHEATYGRFPKTLIFAVNDLPHTSHADNLVRIARDVFGRGESFVQKITGKVDRPLQRIREFRNRPEPGVAVTVDLLSTGVDIPDLEFIVLLRMVKSRILFEQILGRGTRLGEQFRDKSHFTVFDCFAGTLLEYFGRTTGITAEPPERESRSVVEVIEDIWQNRDRAYNVRCLVKRLQRINKEMSAEARELFAVYIPDGDLGRFASELASNLAQDFTGTMKLLRDKEFQKLLLNYPRAKRTFIIAHETVDTVTSAPLITGVDGVKYKPEDYLTAFGQFVKDNAAQVSAIAILLDRPKDWNPKVLSELRQRLMAAPQHFTEENLQKAHQLRYHKALAEIISMVKHAAKDEQPLLTREERVARAFARVTAGKTFTDEQRQWLDRIKAHLVENLSIARDDFDLCPVFDRHGGWNKAKSIFGKTLDRLIKEFNEAVAA